jgi:hypothetical protein
MTAPARTLNLVGQGERRQDAEAMLVSPGDAALVVRGPIRSLVMACPDGCGETLVVNLDPRAGKAWRLDRRGEGVTLYPSVWRDGGCESHFIVWRGYIGWCDRFTAGNREPRYDPTIEPRVLAAMKTDIARSAETIANEIDEIVWDVSRAANRLVDRGEARSKKVSGGWVFLSNI